MGVKKQLPIKESRKTMTNKLEEHKTTLKIKGSNYKRIKELKQKIKEDYDVNIYQSELINMGLSIFLGMVEDNNTQLEKHLIQYNKI